MSTFPINSFSVRKVMQCIVMVVLCGVIAGIAGVITIFLMLWMSRQKFAVDCHEKHGISNRPASRLGGVAVAICATLIYWLSSGYNLPLQALGESPFILAVIGSLAIGIIGLWEDIKGGLRPSIRIAATGIIFAACYLTLPEYIPSEIGFLGLDYLLNYSIVAFILCLIGSIGLLNATNMADGANGLMPLVFMGTFYGFFVLSGDMIFFAVTISLMVFTLFNVLSGKLFLGDAGSYGLGALAAFGALKIMNETNANIWLFLCLAAYPVIDFFVSVVRRKVSGRSALSADNDHLHNRLYSFLRQRVASSLLANSLCGLMISLVTTGVSICLFNYLDINSDLWVWFFFCLVALYSVIFLALSSGSLKEGKT